MKCLLLILILLGAHVAYAYAYKLQFAPQGGANRLTVAGCEFPVGTVAGNCSYYAVTDDNLPLQDLLLGPFWQPD